MKTNLVSDLEEGSIEALQETRDVSGHQWARVAIGEPTFYVRVNGDRVNCDEGARGKAAAEKIALALVGKIQYANTLARDWKPGDTVPVNY